VTLNVVVLVKQVPDLEAMVKVLSADKLDIEERYACSFYDEIALEAALELRQAHPGTELRALSAGGKRAADALRRAVAMGFDQVEHLGDQSLAQADSLGVAQVLAARLSELKPGLVLCGKQALDDDQGAVGPMVAELLGIPHVSAVVSLKVDPAAGTAEVGRKLEGEVWTLRAPLPLLLTAEKGLAKPHIPVVTRVMKAMKFQIPQRPLAELLPSAPALGGRLRRLAYRPPPSRPPVTMMTQPFPKNVAELLNHLQQAGAL
jgi:electron transfer flavoprotein beta subunit